MCAFKKIVCVYVFKKTVCVFFFLKIVCVFKKIVCVCLKRFAKKKQRFVIEHKEYLGKS